MLFIPLRFLASSPDQTTAFRFRSSATQDTLRPLPKPIGKKDKDQDMKHWFPPGSGDVFRSLYRAGLIDQFIKQGKEYIFISNVENLGSTIDLRLLYKYVSVFL